MASQRDPRAVSGHRLGAVDPTFPTLTDEQRLVARMLWAVETFPVRWRETLDEPSGHAPLLYLSGYLREEILERIVSDISEAAFKDVFLADVLSGLRDEEIPVHVKRFGVGCVAMTIRSQDIPLNFAEKFNRIYCNLYLVYGGEIPAGAKCGFLVSREVSVAKEKALVVPRITEPTVERSIPMSEEEPLQERVAELTMNWSSVVDRVFALQGEPLPLLHLNGLVTVADAQSSVDVVSVLPGESLKSIVPLAEREGLEPSLASFSHAPRGKRG